MDIERFEALYFVVNNLCHTVCHYEIVLFPDPCHSLALLGHFCLFVVQVDLYHVQLVVSGLHDAGLVEPYSFKNDSQLEDCIIENLEGVVSFLEYSHSQLDLPHVHPSVLIRDSVLRPRGKGD